MSKRKSPKNKHISKNWGRCGTNMSSLVRSATLATHNSAISRLISSAIVPLESHDLSLAFQPDLYYEKSLRHALRQALRQGKPLSQAVASCRNGSSQKLSQVQLLRQHALRHGTRHALRRGKLRSQAGRWLIMCVFH